MTELNLKLILSAESAALVAGLNNAKTGLSQLKAAAATLEIKSPAEARLELEKLGTAYSTLARSGQLSAGQLNTAHQTMIAKTKELERELAGLPAQVNQTGQSFLSLQTIVGGIALTAGIAEIKRTLTDLVNTGARFELLRTQLNGVMGSIAGGKVAFSWIQDFARDTPLTVGQVTEGFVKLKNFGLDPMNGTYQAIVDSTAKAGISQERLERIVLALGQAWAKNVLQGEEILQLIEAGIPVWDLLSQSTGKTAAELANMAHDGDLGRETISQLIATMGKVNAGLAASQMNTWTGSISNAQDAWEKFLDQVAQGGILQRLTAEIQALTAETGKLDADGSMASFAKSLSQDLVSAVDAVEGTGKAIGDFSGVLQAGAGALASWKLAAWSTAVIEAGGAAALLGRGVAALNAALITNPLGAAFFTAIGAVTFAWRENAQALDQVNAKIDAQIAKASQFRAFTTQLVTLQEALQGANAPQSNQQSIAEIARAAQQGKLSQQEALKLAKDTATEGMSLAQRLANEKQRLTQMEASLETAKTEHVKKLAEEESKAKIKAAKDTIRAAESAQKESLSLEKSLNDKLKKMREDLGSNATSAEDRIREIRRRGLSEEAQQLDIARQAVYKLAQARAALDAGDTGGAQTLAKDAQSLSERLNSNKAAAQGVLAGAVIIKQAKEAEIQATQKAAAEQAKYTRILGDEAAYAKSELDSLQADLKKIQDAKVTASIAADITQAQTAIGEIVSRLAAIPREITVKINAVEARSSGGLIGSIPGFATGGLMRFDRGGLLPGYGGGDRRLALLEDGEFIIRKERTARFLSLLQAINSGSLDAIPGYRKGGLIDRVVLPSFSQSGGSVRSGVEPSSIAGDVVRVEISLGGSEHHLFGPRDSVRKFEAAMRDLNRGRL